MPEMSGAAVCAGVAGDASDAAGMVISGLEEAEAEYEGMNVVFRLKPLLPDNLLASVDSLHA